MSTIQTSTYRRQRDHFEPQDTDPQEQRRLRGLLEQIDYSAFVANREVIAAALPGAPPRLDELDAKLAARHVEHCDSRLTAFGRTELRYCFVGRERLPQAEQEARDRVLGEVTEREAEDQASHP